MRLYAFGTYLCEKLRTKIRFTGTLTHCTGAQTNTKQGLQIDGGTVSAKGQTITVVGQPLPSCAGLSMPPTTLKTRVAFTNACNPIATSVAVETLGTPTSGATVSFGTSGTVWGGDAFKGQNLSALVVLDLDAAALAAACQASGGLSTLNVSGVHGDSLLFTSASAGVPCQNDGACAGATPHCDLARGVCAGCATDRDCRRHLVCEPVSGECRDCVTDANCPPDGPLCDAPSKQCTKTCADSSQCFDPTVGPNYCDLTLGRCFDCGQGGVGCQHAERPLCEFVTRSCVQCLSDADCTPAAPSCGPSGQCSPPCVSTAACPTGLVCDVHQALCVECVTNRDCGRLTCQPNQTCG